MSGRSQTVAVFDVCDTLFSTNTTMGFLRFYARWSQDRRILAALTRWTSRSSPAFYLGAFAYRSLRWDVARTRLIATLRGHSRAELRDAAEEYAATELSQQIVGPIHARLRAHQECGDRVILASSSLDIVIEPVARGLGLEWTASELEFAEDDCTGRLVSDLTGRKPAAISAIVPSGAALHVYTDNRSDRALLRMAERCTIILPKGRKAYRWAGEKCEYVAL